MKRQRLALVLLAVLACSREPDGAGIVLDVDCDATADRTVINLITVTVDGRAEDWHLTQPLPGSLGIKTSPGTKSVVVEGFANGLLRGRWSGTVVAAKGSVLVKDVHLAVVAPSMDASPAAPDGNGADLLGIDAGHTLLDGGKDAGAGGDAGRDGGLDAGSVLLDGGSPDLIPEHPVEAGGKDAAADGGDAGSLPDGSGPDAGADDSSTAPSEPFNGSYSAASQFQIAATTAATGRLGDALAISHSLVVDPGTAILDFAGQAGVPELSTLRSALPDVLENQLVGWMNSYIKTATVNGVTPYSRLAALDDTIRALLLTWSLQSTLALPVGAAGTHTPISLSFPSDSGPVSELLDPAVALSPGTGFAAMTAWPDGLGGAAVVTIGDHSMAFPFGRYALPALNSILSTEYGAANISEYLSKSVDCSSMADSVASHCVSLLCVGHNAELDTICEAGLAEAASQMEDHILGLDFKALHFQSGTATAAGVVRVDSQGATASALHDGVWAVTVDFGDGPQPASATFAASGVAP